MSNHIKQPLEHLAASSPRELLAMYEAILAELRRRNVVRTNDAPLGQFAEYLAQQKRGGTLEDNSKKSYDLVTAEGRRIQVKARLVRDTRTRSERQLSVFRSFDFDDCLILLFDPTYAVRAAVLLPAPAARSRARRREHVNGWVLHATDDVLTLGVDITNRFVNSDQ